MVHVGKTGCYPVNCDNDIDLTLSSDCHLFSVVFKYHIYSKYLDSDVSKQCSPRSDSCIGAV